LRLRIPFGGSDPLHPARAELLAETLLTGTTRRDRVAIDTELALIGGELGTIVDPERLSISGSSLSDGLPTLLDVLADVLTDATYPDGQVVRERDRLVERIAVARTQPRVIAREALQQRRYGDHPVVREVPQAEDVAVVGPEAGRGLHASAVRPRGRRRFFKSSVMMWSWCRGLGTCMCCCGCRRSRWRARTSVPRPCCCRSLCSAGTSTHGRGSITKRTSGMPPAPTPASSSPGI